MRKRPEDSVKVGPTELGREPKDEGVKTGQWCQSQKHCAFAGTFHLCP